MRFHFECGCSYTLWAEREQIKAGLSCCGMHEATPQSLGNILSKCPLLLVKVNSLEGRDEQNPT
jgi:hypothetical protein